MDAWAGSECDGYFARLYERTSDAVNVPFQEVRHGGWEPKKNGCHPNVAFWTAQHKDCKAVRGWLFWPPDQTGRVKFIAHSVVECQGELVDITPIDQNTPREALRFLQHLGTEEKFFNITKNHSQFDYPPWTWEEWRKSQALRGTEGDVDADW